MAKRSYVAGREGVWPLAEPIVELRALNGRLAGAGFFAIAQGNRDRDGRGDSDGQDPRIRQPVPQSSLSADNLAAGDHERGLPSAGRSRVGCPHSIEFHSLARLDLVHAALETANRKLAMLIGRCRGHDRLLLADHDTRSGLRLTLRVDHLPGKHATRSQGDVGDVGRRAGGHRHGLGRRRSLRGAWANARYSGTSDPIRARPTAVRVVQWTRFIRGSLSSRKPIDRIAVGLADRFGRRSGRLASGDIPRCGFAWKIGFAHSKYRPARGSSSAKIDRLRKIFRASPVAWGLCVRWAFNAEQIETYDSFQTAFSAS